jgi:DNA polymerase-3 subunit delta
VYKSKFDPILKRGEIPSSLLLYGDSIFLIDLYMKRIRRAIAPDEVQILYSFEYEFETLKSTLSQSSLFGDRVLVILKSEEKLNGKELKALIQSAERSENNHFLYLYFGSDWKTQLTPFGDNRSVRFFEPNSGEIRNFVKQRVDKFNISLNSEAFNLLADMGEGNLSLLSSEIDKLSLLQGENIDVEKLLTIVTLPSSIGIDGAISELFNTHNGSRFVAEYLQQEWEEIAVISYMTKFIEELFLFRSAMELHEDTSSMAVLGRRLPPAVENGKRKTAQKYSLEKINSLLLLSMEGELQLKSGGVGDRSSIFISKILEIAKELQPY